MHKNRYYLFLLSFLAFAYPAFASINIDVKVLTGKIKPYTVPPRYPIQDLRNKIREEERFGPTDKLMLFFNGKQLMDGQTIDDYKIQENSLLHLIGKGRLRGKAPNMNGDVPIDQDIPPIQSNIQPPTPNPIEQNNIQQPLSNKSQQNIGVDENDPKPLSNKSQQNIGVKEVSAGFIFVGILLLMGYMAINAKKTNSNKKGHR